MTFFRKIDLWIVACIAQPIHSWLEKITFGKNGFWFAHAYLNLFFFIFVGRYAYLITTALLGNYTITIFDAVEYVIVAWFLHGAFEFYSVTVYNFNNDNNMFDISEHAFVRIISILFLSYTFYKDGLDGVAETQWSQVLKYTLGTLSMLSGYAIACRPASYFIAKTQQE